MTQIVDKIDIRKIIENSEELENLLREPFQIELIKSSDNLIFKLKGGSQIHAKVGLTGWGRYEFETLKVLSTKKYCVPMPISFKLLQETANINMKYGRLKREVGVLFYFPIEGEGLDKHLTKINIGKALTFLKKLHEDKSLIDGIIQHYQEIEVGRGLEYIKKLFKGKLAEKIQDVMIKYKDVAIDSSFIHGGPRLEHFIIDNDRIGMIDFEGACIGDPFKDLGIFFTELLFYGVKTEDLIKDYFGRALNEQERIRLNFFKLRALLVKKNFEPSLNVLDKIEDLMN